MKNHPRLCINSLLLLALSTSNVMAVEAPRPDTLKWTFDAHGKVTATPTIATKDGTVYFSAVSVDSDSKENYFLRSLTPGHDGSEATENWAYPYFTATVTTSPALSSDEKVVYVTNNYDNQGRTPNMPIAQLTALDSITAKKDGNRTVAFNKGVPITLYNSTIGAPKVEPVTGNIIVNTFDVTRKNFAYHKQNLRIYQAANGSAATSTRLQLSWFKTFGTPAAWLDFEHREPVLNGHGGTAQVVNDGWASSGFHLASYYWHVDNTASPDDAQPEKWLLWESEPLSFVSSLPHFAVSASYSQLYFVSKSNLFAYDNASGAKLWKEELIPGVTLAEVAPTVALQNTHNPKSVIAQAGTLYVGGMNGHLYGVHADEAGAALLFDLPISTTALDKPMAIDPTNDILYVVDAAGALFAFDLRTESSEESELKKAILWQIEDAHIETAPVVSTDGSVVVASGNQIKAYVGGRVTA